MKYFFSLFLLSLPLQSIAQVEYRQYAIKVVGIKVGELIATKTTTENSIIEYTLNSIVDVNFLVYHLKVDYKVKSTLKGDIMLNSEVNVISNRGDFETKTSKTKDGFKLKSKQPNKEIDKLLTRPIRDTFSSMHFNEPTDIDKVYAEFYGDFIKIKSIGPHKYSGILDDNKDEYYFKDGLLIKAIKKNPIANMVIVLEKAWVK